MSNRAPFPIQPELTAIAIGYRNKRLIADDVLPRVFVGKQEFKYFKHTLAEGFTIPDTKVGRTSQPNKIEFSASEETEATIDYGLDDPIPQADIDNAPPNYDPVGRGVEGLTDLILLDREKRASDLVFGAANYAAANKVTLAGADQFSDFVGSDPIGTIMDCLDAMIMRANIMVIGRPAFSQLIRHPKIVKAVLRNSGDSGVVRREDIAALLELDAVFVGEAFLNTAKKGQTASLSRVWGKHISLIYRDTLATTNRGTTFGLTAQFGTRVSGATPDRNIGLRGGQMLRVGESVKELITADNLGFFIQNAVA